MKSYLIILSQGTGFLKKNLCCCIFWIQLGSKEFISIILFLHLEKQAFVCKWSALTDFEYVIYNDTNIYCQELMEMKSWKWAIFSCDRTRIIYLISSLCSFLYCIYEDFFTYRKISLEPFTLIVNLERTQRYYILFGLKERNMHTKLSYEVKPKN